MQRNSHLAALPPKYIFSEIQEREARFRKEYPQRNLISLSIGDTSQPLIPSIVDQLVMTSQQLGTEEGYFGYGPERGLIDTSIAISKILYNDKVPAKDIFISDGAGCDIGRLQILFGQNVTIGVQNPSYPAYHDTGALLRGKDSILPIPCTPENHFFPDLEHAKQADILFFCSPCNPTGHAFSLEEMTQLVAFAKKNHKILVIDAAYGLFTNKCQSIYQVAGADEVAIEIGSFSKMAGFSGVRLGWTIVPQKLPYNLHADWSRVVSTFFNGPSYLSQMGAVAALTNISAVKQQVRNYLDNALLLKEALHHDSVELFGGVDAPYLWMRMKGKNSWQAFDELLDNCGVTTMPGIGFGQYGDGFLRISCLGKKHLIQEAALRLQHYFRS